ncbi:MAG: hypothetical protein KJO07_02980, partial [Deltaproteobacteria bacterium]|nr:hypothetical protein [Deltaproteobacteria bacterium]
MFLSKIWFFLLAIIAAAAITVALVMPRPAERATAKSERKRLQRACSVVNLVLRDNAGSRVRQASSAARGYGLGEVTAKAGKGNIVSGEDNANGRARLVELGKEFESSDIPKPAFMFLVDGKGRVIARSGLEDSSYGDVLAGYYALDDALAGYMRDDVWLYENKLYRVAVTPVFTNSLARSGALVIGYGFDKPFAESIGKDLEVQMSFYARGEAMASNHAIQVHEDVVKKYGAELQGKKLEKSDCVAVEPFAVSAGGTTYNSLIARLPGEARQAGAFYAVFVEQPSSVGFSGTLDEVKK